MYNTFTLSNGLRIIQHPSVGNVVYCGYAVKAGTRDERQGEEGLAHFCEHASFKGTSCRRAWQVIQCIESVGGELNAYTNKEATVYYCACLKEHLPRAVDLLTDMVFRSVFPEVELEKEKEVICDEIESYNDSPAELIYDEFENRIFRGHPLGHSVLGTKESVRSFSSADALRFTQRLYRPDNAVFFINGDIPFETLKRMLTKLHKDILAVPADSRQSFAPPVAEEIVVNGTHQAHVLLGRRAYDINHPRRIPLYLLNNILGGPAMSSLLNMALREKNGLVYTVESGMASFADTGLWSVYFGCDPHDVKRCLRLVRRELDRLMAKPLSPRRLLQAKRQLKGQIALACDSRESFTLDFAKSFLHYGWEKDVSALCADIDKVSAEDILAVANDLFRQDTLELLVFE